MQSSAVLWLKVIIHTAVLCAVGFTILDYFSGQLTANPIEELTKRAGKFTLITLLLTLSCTPCKILLGWNQIIKARRLLGLYSFFFATLHFLTFIGLDYALNLELLIKDVAKKRYVIAGFSVYIILTLLAATSFRFFKVKLGDHWRYIQALIYPAASLAVLHFAWQMKANTNEPVFYGMLILFLFILRLSFVQNWFQRFIVHQEGGGNQLERGKTFRK